MEENDKRYLVFRYELYYPGGGLGDMCCSFEKIEKAIDYIDNSDYECHELYDRIEGVELDIDELKREI